MTPIDLGALDGVDGFTLTGAATNDYSGFSVSIGGDFNGDGFVDLVIGARQADPGGISSAGEAYVVFGKADGFTATIDLSALDGADGFTLQGLVVNGWIPTRSATRSSKPWSSPAEVVHP